MYADTGPYVDDEHPIIRNWVYKPLWTLDNK